MSKTKALRRLVTSLLQTTPGGAYYREAPKDAAYPYKTFALSSATFTDARDDLVLDVDIWDRSADSKTVEDVADEIETLLREANTPAPPIYPTFFRDARFLLDDPDKNLQHIQLRFMVQLYETEE